MSQKKTISEMCCETKVCAIMRNVALEDTCDYAQAAFNGGVHMFEVAMNSKDGAKQIRMLRELFGDRAYVGAGTVINEERCVAAHKAGAQFFLTPSTSIVTLEYCKKHDIPILPGVLTPTDVAVCLEYGYTTMKLFPAGDMPMNYIKSLQGPFDGTEFVAVGGVTLQNTRDFMDHGFIGVGIGSNLMKKEYVKEHNWEAASKELGELIAAL